MTEPKQRPRSEGPKKAKPEQATPTPDNADFGQPAASPGTRGGATSFGGIKRETPRSDK